MGNVFSVLTEHVVRSEKKKSFPDKTDCLQGDLSSFIALFVYNWFNLQMLRFAWNKIKTFQDFYIIFQSFLQTIFFFDAKKKLNFNSTHN